MTTQPHQSEIVERTVPPERADDSRGAERSPSAAPATYLELCMREFAKNYYEQSNADDYEFSKNVYEGE